MDHIATPATLKELFSQINMPPIGEYWEGQGGINCGPVIEKGIPTRFLIRSTEFGEDLEWGAYGKKIAGADSKRDGAANTKAILASGHKHPAAEWAAGYTKDGQTGFFLPAQFELNQVAMACLEDMPDDWFWSSTQYSAYYAWGQFFDSGSAVNDDKDYVASAVAVRSLFI